MNHVDFSGTQDNLWEMDCSKPAAAGQGNPFNHRISPRAKRLQRSARVRQAAGRLPTIDSLP